jgi:F-type H+-transporting ATPase subunit delta
VRQAQVGLLEAAGEVLDARMGFARARISSAQPMPDPQRAALVAELERLTGNRLRALFTVDEALIGGALARIGSTVYDGSVKGRLENLGRRLAAE